MRVVSGRIKDHALVELFNGEDVTMQGKLALDHIVPIIWGTETNFKMHLVCRINHKENGSYVYQLFYAVNHFSEDQVLAGGRDWVGFAEVLSYPMIKALKNLLSTLNDPNFLNLDHNQGCPPEMRRIDIG